MRCKTSLLICQFDEDPVLLPVVLLAISRCRKSPFKGKYNWKISGSGVRCNTAARLIIATNCTTSLNHSSLTVILMCGAIVGELQLFGLFYIQWCGGWKVELVVDLNNVYLENWTIYAVFIELESKWCVQLLIGSNLITVYQKNWLDVCRLIATFNVCNKYI